MIFGPAVDSGGGPYWYMGVETGQPARPPHPPSKDLSVLCPGQPLLCRLVGTLLGPSTGACPPWSLGVKTPRSRWGWARSLKQSPRWKADPQQDTHLLFSCEARKGVRAALCEQKPAWDMALSYYFGDLCKRLSRHRVSFSCWRSIFSQRQSLQIRTPDRFGSTVPDFKKSLFTVL